MNEHDEENDMAVTAAVVATALKERVGWWWRTRREAARRDEGMSTSEYAVGTIVILGSFSISGT
ncbi:DUF4244 domain-containing protein [Streptomyces sp. NPDC058861]|uniref:DUF4244 domain-containing protein n=1 Tax=Streptomyces sp. NPDC058861 TaxID=3346653 RepID=UPI0036782EE1